MTLRRNNRFVALEDVRLMIKDLKNNKATGLDIPLKLLKEYDFNYDSEKCNGFRDGRKISNGISMMIKKMFIGACYMLGSPI